jgi:hypothetical protein
VLPVVSGHGHELVEDGQLLGARYLSAIASTSSSRVLALIFFSIVLLLACG